MTTRTLVDGQSVARRPMLQRLRRATLGWRPLLIEHSPPWACQLFGPLAHRLDMLLVDHGVFRLLYLNKHRVGARAWRAAQPAPHHIRAMARQGVRTIINLRGARACGSYWTERDTCREHGIALVDFQVRSRDAPSPERIHAARDLFERVEYPMLMHCKSGADRAGLMSVLYLHLVEKVPDRAGQAPAGHPFRAFPLRRHRHSRLRFRALPARQCSHADVLPGLGRHHVRPRGVEAGVPLHGLGQPPR